MPAGNSEHDSTEPAKLKRKEGAPQPPLDKELDEAAGGGAPDHVETKHLDMHKDNLR